MEKLQYLVIQERNLSKKVENIFENQLTPLTLQEEITEKGIQSFLQFKEALLKDVEKLNEILGYLEVLQHSI